MYTSAGISEGEVLSHGESALLNKEQLREVPGACVYGIFSLYGEMMVVVHAGWIVNVMF